MKKVTFLFKAFIFIALLNLNQGFSQGKPAKNVFGREVKQTSINPENGVVRCFTTEYEESLQAKDSKRMTDAEFEAWINPLIENYRNMQTVSSQSGGIITIPVVVHVIHNGEALGTAPNITDAQVISQITVMNNDFRRMAGTPGFNSSSVGADTMIQFALAKQDPNGNPTNGIDRRNLCQSSWSTSAIDATVKPTTIWDPTLYLNMWSVNFSDSSLLGYAQFPDASGLGGLNSSGGPANSDGVVANFSTFGSKNYNDGTFLLSPPYDEGRTMTHEVGHWIGLRHIWGDGPCATDYCADTPTAHTANFNCPSVVSCGSAALEMVQNYMDYTDDPCMNIFTVNQKDRMTVIMNNAARRVTLKTSTKDQPIALFANDAELKMEPNCATGGSASCGSGGGAAVQKLTIYNRGTSNLTSASMTYSLNGGSTTTYTWTGSLTPNKFATFNMPVTGGTTGTINIALVNANGVADQRASNNTVSGAFSAAAGPTNYTMNNVTFHLKKDDYGSETTWNIKNSGGTTLYSGGPYTDVDGGGLLITQSWTLPSNNCYTFTINDSYGDGICCDFGNGYYDVKSTDGTITLLSGGQFGSTESKSFSINLLSNSEFDLAGGIYVYPNPSTGTLNISVPSDFGLPTNYVIYNSIGQVIREKSVTSENDMAINTTTISTGVYFIKVAKGTESKTLRFIKE